MAWPGPAGECVRNAKSTRRHANVHIWESRMCIGVLISFLGQFGNCECRKVPVESKIEMISNLLEAKGIVRNVPCDVYGRPLDRIYRNRSSQ